MVIASMSHTKSAKYYIKISSIKQISAKNNMTCIIKFLAGIRLTAKIFLAEAATPQNHFYRSCHSAKIFVTLLKCSPYRIAAQINNILS